MKRTGFNHTKLKKLSIKLGVPLYVAIGILESLWHLAAREAPCGDIGKLSDEDIALGIDYRESSEKLIEVLVDCKWLDRCDKHRLVIHDWKDHCEETVKKYISRNKLNYAEVSCNVSSSSDTSTFCQTCLDISSLPKPKPEPMPLPLPESDDGGGGMQKFKSDKPATFDTVSALDPFPENVRQPALQAAIAYQMRRYKALMPAAEWYPRLLHEAGTVFEVQNDPLEALARFQKACETKPTVALPRDASFMQIAEFCGIRRKRAGPGERSPPQPPPRIYKDYTAERLAQESRTG